MVTYAEKRGVLASHKDVLDAIREELYLEEQQRLDRHNHKGGNVLKAGTPYPPININVLPSQSNASGLDISAAKEAADSAAVKDMSPLRIPGPRDVAVRGYVEWHTSNVSDDTLKAAFDRLTMKC